MLDNIASNRQTVSNNPRRKAKNMNITCPDHQERQGRYFSEDFGKWYDLYPCPRHGFHVDVDHDNEW